MPLTLKQGIRELIAAAETEIETIDAKTAMNMQSDDNVVIVDLRDVREIQREGRIPGSFHAPRGMLEFWVDPDSPYHKDIFASGKKFVFHCASGWRSALATKAVQDMGLPSVCHIGGGFKAWQEAEGDVEQVEKRA